MGYLFSKKGVIVVEKSNVNEDKLTEIALDAGADDLSDEGDTWEVITEPKEFRCGAGGDQGGEDYAGARRGDDGCVDLPEAGRERRRRR